MCQNITEVGEEIGWQLFMWAVLMRRHLYDLCRMRRNLKGIYNIFPQRPFIYPGLYVDLIVPLLHFAGICEKRPLILMRAVDSSGMSAEKHAFSCRFATIDMSYILVLFCLTDSHDKLQLYTMRLQCRYVSREQSLESVPTKPCCCNGNE